MKLILLIAFSIVWYCNLIAQTKGKINPRQTTKGVERKLISGPMLGGVELLTAQIWLEVKPNSKRVDIVYFSLDDSTTLLKRTKQIAPDQDFAIVKFDLVNLKMNCLYDYKIYIDDILYKLNYPTQFKTKELWQWRKPAPDFSFIAGSCSYVNQPEVDRPGKPYGGDSSIFATMAKEKSAFCLWLGDNWYTREVDYTSAWGFQNRASHDRSPKILQPLLASMPHYAIWDDHDFGPNDCNGSFIFKEDSRKVFNNYWLNPTSGENNEGIYTKMSYGDIDVFMLDDRTYRSADNMPDSINGFPNPNKVMFGIKQMQWLENSLLASNASFKIIATGSQMLNPTSPYDCFLKFPIEYNYFMDMIKRNKTEGLLFLTGDRHHTEVIKVNRTNGGYPLYDITASPITSGTHKFNKEEANNPNRIFGLDQKQNYARVSISGKRKDRVLKFEFLGIDGAVLGTWSVDEKSLK